MSVERVVRKDGSVVWRVRWRQGGRNRSKVLGAQARRRGLRRRDHAAQANRRARSTGCRQGAAGARRRGTRRVAPAAPRGQKRIPEIIRQSDPPARPAPAGPPRRNQEVVAVRSATLEPVRLIGSRQPDLAVRARRGAPEQLKGTRVALDAHDLAAGDVPEPGVRLYARPVRGHDESLPFARSASAKNRSFASRNSARTSAA